LEDNPIHRAEHFAFSSFWDSSVRSLQSILKTPQILPDPGKLETNVLRFHPL
jgi:hypothetical protein